MQKKGELSSTAIVTLVMAIAGFIILAYFITTNIYDGDSSNRDICHLSVITRATTPDFAEKLIPLKCQTEKICLSKGDDCPEFAGETNVRKINVKTEEDIEQTVAYSMYDCWAIMGEGKIDVFGGQSDSILRTFDPSRVFGDAKTTCLICSRITLSPNLQKETALLDSVDVNNYLETRQVPGSEFTFLQTFTDRQVRSFPREMREEFGPIGKENQTNQIGIIFMQILTEEKPWEVGTSIATEAGAFVLGSSIGISPLGKLITLNWFTTAVTAAAVGGAGAAAFFQTYRNRQISAAYCGEFSSSTDQKNNGCSVVTTFDYNDLEKLNSYCGKFEGIQ